MRERIDKLALRVGRDFPPPVRLALELVWWVLLLLTAAALIPSIRERLSAGSPVPLPTFEVVFPWMLGLTGLNLLHGYLVKRRRSLLGGTLLEPLSSTRWMERSRAPLWLVFGLGVVLMVGNLILIERDTRRTDRKCETYEAAHRMRPDQVVDCPFR